MRITLSLCALLALVLLTGIMTGCSSQAQNGIPDVPVDQAGSKPPTATQQYRAVIWQNQMDVTSQGEPVIVRPDLAFSIEVVPAGQLVNTKGGIDSPFVKSVKFTRNGVEIPPSDPALSARGGPRLYSLSIVGDYQAEVIFSVSGIERKLIQPFTLTDGDHPFLVLVPYNSNGQRLSWVDTLGRYFSPIGQEITVKPEWAYYKPAGVKTSFSVKMEFTDRGGPAEQETESEASIVMGKPGIVTVTGNATDTAGFHYSSTIAIVFSDGYGFSK